jgi:hypothetical protein
MADVYVARIEFIANNTYGEFVLGDILDIYLDPSVATTPAYPLSITIAGITVYLNGTIYAGSATALDLSKTVRQEINTRICKGASLLNVSPGLMFYPFASYYSEEDHYECVVNSPTCDLMIIGAPDITPSSTSTATDGQIILNASSSNSIKGKIGSDFAYDDGTGQSTLTFTGLLAGDYRIFLKDEVGCALNILVTIPVDNTYGTKYRIDYLDNNGWTTRIDIKRRGYAGAITDLICDATPFVISLRGEGSTDKFTALLSVNAVLNLVSVTEAQFVELYTNDHTLYRIEYSKNTGSGLSSKLLLKVLPFQYGEDYVKAPYDVQVSAIDGLPDLKSLYLFQSDGQNMTGEMKLIKLISHCLKSTGLELPIRVACNLYASGMDQTDADDPLDQAYCDLERFYIEKEEPDLEFVLRAILEPFGARITQWDGRWNIVRVEEMTSSYDYRDFDADGDYDSEGTYDPIKDIGTDISFTHVDQYKDIKPGYGRIRAIYKLGLRNNILRNGDFSLKQQYLPTVNAYTPVINTDHWALYKADALEEGYEQIDTDNVAYKITGRGGLSGDSYLESKVYDITFSATTSLKISCRIKVVNPTFGLVIPGFPAASTTYKPNVPYFKIRMLVSYAGLYLQGDGTWTTAANEIVFHCPTSDFDKYVQVEVIANPPTLDVTPSGDDFKVRLYHVYVYHSQFGSLAAMKALQTLSGVTYIIPTGHQTECPNINPVSFYVLEESTDTPDDFQIVRPDDYHATNNPRQWILQEQYQYPTIRQTEIPTITPQRLMPSVMCVDKVSVEYLVNGNKPLDAIVRTVPAEANNKELFEKELYLGSYSVLWKTEKRGVIGFGGSFITSWYLDMAVLHTGYLRDNTGAGFEQWTRDGVAELDLLHGILLRSYAAQYSASWRKLTGSIFMDSYFGLLDMIRVPTDDDMILLPMSLDIDDKSCSFSGEYLEMIQITGGSDGSGSAPFSSGFTTGFGGGFD